MKGQLNNSDVDAPGGLTYRVSTEKRVDLIAGHPDTANLILGTVIGLGVCLPLIGGGRLFLLDWTIGPHVTVATQSVLGLNGGLTAGIVGSVLMALLTRILGGAATWLPVLVFFPIATVGAGRLAGRSGLSRIAAGALYAVNPFVFNRLYAGHLPLLIGYALLPFATAAAFRSLSSPAIRWAVPALWWAVLTALSPHFAWIYGVIVTGVVVIAMLNGRHLFRRVIVWFGTVTGAFAVMSAYILLPHTATNLPTQVGQVSLDLYRTTGDPHLGLFANVLALYGFWRTGPGPRLPKDVISGWPFLMFAIFVIAAVGVWYALRKSGPQGESTTLDDHTESASRPLPEGGGRLLVRDPNTGKLPSLDQKQLALLLLFVGVTGYFLALGSQGPTGGLFSWAYNHVPFFALMREPQKFLMLLAMAYAVLFGWGVERLSQVNVSSSRLGAVATTTMIGVVLPLGYTATIFDGLTGQIATSSLPAAYQQADTLMGTGQGNVLALPWHIYMEYPFTNGRVVANVAPTAFRRNVISGDNVESGGVETQSTSPRSAYLQLLFARGTTFNSFGALVAPLGVQYVVLSKTVDWGSYDWLMGQKDLKLVLDTSSLEVWRNTAYVGVGSRVTKLATVSGFPELLALANSHQLGGGAVVTSSAANNSANSTVIVPSKGPSTGPSVQLDAVHQISPVAYQIPSGAPGWVVVDAPYQRGWSLNGRSAMVSSEGTVLVRVGANGGVLRFTPWGKVRLGYIVSSVTFLALVAIVVVDWRRRSNRFPNLSTNPEPQPERLE